MVNNSLPDKVYQQITNCNLPEYMKECSGYLVAYFLSSGVASVVENYVPGATELTQLLRSVAISSLVMSRVVIRDMQDDINRRLDLVDMAGSKSYDADIAQEVLDELYSSDNTQRTTLTPYGARLLEGRLLGKKQRKLEDAIDPRTYVTLTRFSTLVSQTVI